MRTHKPNRNRLHGKGMPQGASQISDWLGAWLRERRVAAGYPTQLSTVGKLPVTYGVVTSAEQGRPPELANFLNLVIAYGAEEALVKQIREWRATGVHLVQGNRLEGQQMPDVKQSRGARSRRS